MKHCSVKKMERMKEENGIGMKNTDKREEKYLNLFI